MLCLLFTAASLTAQNSAKVQSMKQEQAKLQSELNKSQSDLSVNKQQVGVHQDTIRQIDVKLEERLKRISNLQVDIERLDSQCTVLEGQVETQQKLLDKKRAQYVESLRIARAYRGIKSPVLFIFSANSISQMFRRARYATQYAGYQRKLGEEVMRVQSALLKKKNELLAARGELTGKVGEIRAERQALARQQQGHKDQVATLQVEQSNIQQRISEQQAKLKQLNSQIEAVVAAEIEAARKKAAEEAARKKAAAEAARKKAAEEAARKKAAAEAARKKAAEEAARKKAEAEAKAKAAKAAADKAAREAAKKAAKKDAKIEKKVEKTADKAAEEAARAAKEAKKAADKAAKAAKAAADKAAKAAKDATAAPTPAPTPTPAPAAASANSLFEQNRGRLPVPITGSYTIGTKFGVHNVQEHVKVDSKGVDYVGHPGAQARAIFDGEVTYVFQFGSTKNVLVRHGSYISVYCNLSSVSVKKGQHVSARTPLGSVATDENGTCTLHFQLRKETSKLNPEQWIGR